MGTWCWEVEPNTLYWSPELYRIFGVDPQLGPPDPERRRTLYTPESLARLEAVALACLQTGESFCIQLDGIRGDGGALYLEAHGAVTMDDSGKVARLHGMVLDRTEERKTLAAFLASEAQFASSFEYAVVGMALVSPEGRWLRVNRAVCDMLGYTEAELLARTFQEITYPDDLEIDLRLVQELLSAERQTYQLEKRYVHKSGRVVWALLSVSLVRNSAGSPQHFISQVVDISARKQAEAERERFFTLSLDMFCVSGLDGYLRQVNPAWTRTLGWSREELLSRPVSEFVHPEDVAATEAGRVGLMQGQPIRDFENRYRCKDGSYRWLAWRSFSLPNEGMVFAVARDITDHKAAQETLRQAADRLTLAARAACVGIWDWDISTDYIVWDEAMHRLYGLSSEASPEGYKTWERSLHPDDHVRMRDEMRLALEGEKDFETEFRVIWPDGSIHHLQANGLIQRDALGRPLRMLGTNWDITERKRIEEELRIQAHRLQLAKELAGIGVFDYDIANDSLLWDERQHAIYGIDPGAGTPGFARWRECMHPDDLAAVEADRAAILADPRIAYDLNFRIVRASDGVVRYLRSVASVERDPSGRPTRIIGMNLDITEEVEIQQRLRQVSEASEAASRAKSEFLAMMSHEIRTPMNAVIGYGDLLQLTELTPEQSDFVVNIQRGGASLLEIIDGILDFSKIEAGKLALRADPLDPRALVEDVCDLLAVTAHAQGLQFDRHIAADVPARLLGDAPALRRILTNLVGNAIKFTERGSVHVSVTCERSKKNLSHLCVEVADTGIGLSAETLERLFLPFSQGDSSHKRRFGGTGLGLVISRRLAEAMGGSLSAQNRLEGGAMFILTFPIQQEMGAERRAFGAANDASSGVGLPPAANLRADLRILLAEDNAVNRRLMVQLLQRLGCRCDQVENGREALEAMERQPYDIVLMDIQMPVMDGWEASRAIREREARHPEAARSYLIAQSASAMEEDARRCRECGMDDHLCKPITIQALAQALGRAPLASCTSLG